MADTQSMQERLAEVGKHIDDARHAAEEHSLLPDTTPESTFIEPDVGQDEPDPELELDEGAPAPG